MKKLISLIAALVVTTSAISSVFAATVPGDANLDVDITVTDLQVQDGSGNEKYSMQIDLNGLGTLGTTRISYFRVKVIGDVEPYLVDDEFFPDESNLLSDQYFTGGASSIFNGLDLVYTLSNGRYMYKSVGDVEAATVFSFYGTKGDTITVETTIGYTECSGNTVVANDLRADSTDSQNIVLPGSSDPELELTVTGAGANNGVFPNGYIWTANVTKGTASVTAFDIVFEAGAESLPKSINNLEVLNGWLGSGSAEFQIGLKTTKTLTGATFTVTDDDSATDAVDWVPSV